MKFDKHVVDAHAPAVVSDCTFQLQPVDVHLPRLDAMQSFQSAPDDDDSESRNGKAQRFATHFEEGRRAETRFREAAVKQGWIQLPTSSFDDKFRRIDAAFFIEGVGIVLVDIKGAKKLSRSDPDFQYRFHWVELHDTGSLFSGDSTILALEVGPGRFALYNKKELRSWVSECVKGPPVARSCQALCRPYQRHGKLTEWITLVDVSQMHSVCLGII